MASYRIEIKFVGEAPDGELARAHILAGERVTAGISELSGALDEAGLKHQVEAHVIRTTPKRPRARIAAAAE